MTISGFLLLAGTSDPFIVNIQTQRKHLDKSESLKTSSAIMRGIRHVRNPPWSGGYTGRISQDAFWKCGVERPMGFTRLRAPYTPTALPDVAWSPTRELRPLTPELAPCATQALHELSDNRLNKHTSVKASLKSQRLSGGLLAVPS